MKNLNLPYVKIKLNPFTHSVNRKIRRMKEYKDEHEEYMRSGFDKWVEMVISNPDSVLNQCAIINAQMASGKTYQTFNHYMREFINNGVNVLMYVYPSEEILSYQYVFDLIQYHNKFTNKRITHIKLKGDTDVNQFERNLDLHIDGETVYLITTTFSSAYANTNAEKILNICKNNKSILTPSIIMDECHMWSTSSQKNYRNNTGNSTTNFNATAYNILSKWAEYTPWVLGLTATLTPEHSSIVDNPHPNVQMLDILFGDELHKNFPIENYSMKWNVIVNPLPTKLLMYKSGWMGNFRLYNPNNNSGEIFKSFVGEFESKNSYLRHGGGLDWETVMIVKVVRDTNSNKASFKNVVPLLQNTLKELEVNEDEQSIVVMNEKGYTFYNLNGMVTSVSKQNMDFNTLRNMLIDKSNPLRYCLILDKGNAGMDIPNAKWLFSFNPRSKENNDGAITYSPIQLVGRLMRINPYGDINEFTKEWGYNLENFIKSQQCNTDLLLETNSFNVMVPDNTMWRDVYSKVSNNYCVNLKTVRQVVDTFIIDDDMDLIISAKEDTLITLQNSYDAVKKIDPTTLKFSEWFPFDSTLVGASNKTGVYKILHKPTNSIKYIGQSSNIGQRKIRHRKVYTNKGIPLTSSTKSSHSDSVAGRKMYQTDSDINNWYISYMITENTELARKIEIYLGMKYKPEFNSEFMLGCGS